MYYRKKTLGKVATIKRFEYSPLGSELEKQTDIAKKHYQKLDKVYEFDEAINKNDRNSIIRKYKKSDLIYNAHHSFCKYHYFKKIDNLSLESNCSFLATLFNDLDKFRKLKTQKEETKEQKTNVYNTALELYNNLLGTYFDEYFDLPDAKKSKIDPEYDLI